MKRTLLGILFLSALALVSSWVPVYHAQDFDPYARRVLPKASDPASSAVGSLWLNTAVDKFKIKLASGIKSMLTTADLDTDGTLAANSDAKVPSQKAVKTYVDAHAGSGGGGRHSTQSELIMRFLHRPHKRMGLASQRTARTEMS